MRHSTWLSALVLGALAAPASAQLIVGNDQAGEASIYNIDISTGVATAIHTSTGIDAKPWGMAYDNINSILYWNNAGTLFSSVLGPTLAPANMGQLSLNGAMTNFVGLSFFNGVLYGTRNVGTEAVYSIDLTTLSATVLYAYPSTFDFGGLDHDAATGRLYGLTDSPATGRGLYEIDPFSQTTTFHAPYPAGEVDIDGLAVYNGLAYYVSDGPNTAQASFYVFDIASGTLVGTLPSPFTGSGTFSAATFAAPIPEPSQIALWAVGLAGLLGARKMRKAPDPAVAA